MKAVQASRQKDRNTDLLTSALNYENSNSVTASTNILFSCSVAIHPNASASVPALF